MKNKKCDINAAHSSQDESTQKINSPKKSLSFASSSPPLTNNSSFSKNSLEDLCVFGEGDTLFMNSCIETMQLI